MAKVTRAMVEQAEVDYMEHLIRKALAMPRNTFVNRPPTASEMDRFLGPAGAPDEYDHDAEEI